MTPFQKRLQAHKGGLLRLKTQLYWYGGRGYDGNPGRVCLILDATQVTAHLTADVVHAVERDAAAIEEHGDSESGAALLLIDGSPQWVWAAAEDVEIL